jgi:putative DNA primase/helicase
VASILCGALPWRPHAGVTGPAQGGKSTILRGIGHILTPFAVIKEGISTEAGIRQSIGYDARPVILDELETESSRDRGRVEKIIKLMRSSSSATGGVARGTPEGKAITFNTRAMFLIGAINIHRISAADASRMLRFELAKVPTDQGRRSHPEVVDLLARLENIGPAFCQFAIDHAGAILHSRPIIHRVVPAVQERQADNLATVLAGYWVAFNLRPITSSEAAALVDQHGSAIEEQREAIELDDATECLNALLGFTVTMTVTDDTEGGPRSHREPVLLGNVLARVLAVSPEGGTDLELLSQFGIRPEDNGFLIANSHPGLRKVFRETRWEGGMWSSALSRLDGAKKTPQKRFAEGVRSLAVWIPSSYLPETGPPDF